MGISKEDLIILAEELGGYVRTVKPFDSDDGHDTIIIFLGERGDVENTRAFDHTLRFWEEPEGWVIGIGQFGKTRKLSDLEIELLIQEWFADPIDSKVFEYEE